MDFYQKVVHALGAQPADPILVLCGGAYDAAILKRADFTDVTISNLMREGHAARGTDYGSYKFAHEDAEKISFAARTFDWAIVHAGLHHCVSPHTALLEMLRVSRKGVLVIESRDSLLMRAAIALGFSSQYELEAVALSGFKSGGVRDSATPNYIYRWTEREVEKLIESAYPQRVNRVQYFYHLAPPNQRLSMVGLPRRVAARALGLGLTMFQKFFPRQCNEFGFIIRHEQTLKPWMDGDGLRRDYKLGFDPAKYRPESV